MNSNTNDILARIRNGEDPEKIANSFIEALNEANRIHTDEVKAKEKAKSDETARLKDAEQIAKSIIAFTNKWFPDMKDEMNDFSGDEIIEIFTAAKDIGDEMSSMLGSLSNIASKFKIGKSDEDVISNFLNKMGL